MDLRLPFIILGLALLPVLPAPAARAQDASAILRSAFDNWRANSSHAVLEMDVVKPGLKRSLSLESWTQGQDRALVRFTAPAKDAGNATLQLKQATYVFNPKLNQIIKLPASAMSQSWMGSDFSYDDLARSEKVISDFTSTILKTGISGGHKTWEIRAVPKPGVPIVWGKEVLVVRDDGVLLSIGYYDQLGKRVRIMTTDRIATLGGRPYPVVLTMRTDAKPGQYTRITTKAAEFDIPLPSYLFTTSNLQNPRN